MEAIPFVQAMEIAETGRPFSVSFCTADYRRKTGGELVELDKVVLKELKRSDKKNDGGSIKAESLEPKTARPHHRFNDTRNLLLANGQTRKMHPRLMVTFNNMEILY